MFAKPWFAVSFFVKLREYSKGHLLVTSSATAFPAAIATKFDIPVAALLDANEFRFKFRLKSTSEFHVHTQIWVPKNGDGENKTEGVQE